MKTLIESLLDDENTLLKDTTLKISKMPRMSISKAPYFIQAWYDTFYGIVYSGQDFTSMQLHFVLRLFKEWLPKYHLVVPKEKEIGHKAYMRDLDERNLYDTYVYKHTKPMDRTTLNKIYKKIDSLINKSNINVRELEDLFSFFLRTIDGTENDYFYDLITDGYYNEDHDNKADELYDIILKELGKVNIVLI